MNETDRSETAPAGGPPLDCGVGPLDKVRADFEAWASDCGQWPQAVERSGDGYKMMNTHLRWTAWQACSVAARVEIERLRVGHERYVLKASLHVCADAIRKVETLK